MYSRRGGRLSLEPSLRRKAGRSLFERLERSLLETRLAVGIEAGFVAEAWLAAEGWFGAEAAGRFPCSVRGRFAVVGAGVLRVRGWSRVVLHVGWRLRGGEAVELFSFFPRFGEAGAVGTIGLASEGAAFAWGEVGRSSDIATWFGYKSGANLAGLRG